MRTLMRGKSFWLVLAGVALCHWAMPGLVRTDSSAAADRELTISLVLSGVFALTMIATATLATALTSTEIAQKRFQLARTRPAGMFATMAGKWLALVTLAATAITLSCTILYFQVPGEKSRIATRPQMKDALALAEEGLDAYLAHPQTPQALKHMSRERVLSHLAARIMENKTEIAPGKSVEWEFPGSNAPEALQLRLANEFGLNTVFTGEITTPRGAVAFTNTTSRLLEIPVKKSIAMWQISPVIKFKNTGKFPIYCSFYRDVAMLSDGGSFLQNLILAAAVMISMCAAVSAISLFFGMAFSRSVAVFSLLALLAASLCSPAIGESRKDLATVHRISERIGLSITRAVTVATSSIMAPSPVDDLSKRIRREAGKTAKDLAMQLFVISPLFLALAAVIGRRRNTM